MSGFLKYRDRVPADVVVRVAVDVRGLRDRVDREVTKVRASVVDLKRSIALVVIDHGRHAGEFEYVQVM